MTVESGRFQVYNSTATGTAGKKGNTMRIPLFGCQNHTQVLEDTHLLLCRITFSEKYVLFLATLSAALTLGSGGSVSSC